LHVISNSTIPTSYKQALHSAKQAKELAATSKPPLPFTRPGDYYAEMIKSDAHMSRIRQRLLDEKAGMKKGEEKRKEREMKKIGKQVQIEKLKERRERGKEEVEKVKGLKRSTSFLTNSFFTDWRVNYILFLFLSSQNARIWKTLQMHSTLHSTMAKVTNNVLPNALNQVRDREGKPVGNRVIRNMDLEGKLGGGRSRIRERVLRRSLGMVRGIRRARVGLVVVEALVGKGKGKERGVQRSGLGRADA
jgi:hypothetical protein